MADDLIIRHQQRGIALIALLAIIALGASYWIYAALNANTASASVERSKRDSDVLQQAKAALIGQIALQAAASTEPNPGRLPCPENPADAGNASEGLPNTATAGNPFGSCGTGATVVVGRLPWKALGIDKLQDSATEPLWYAVAPNWVTAGPNTIINSDTPPTGGLTSTLGEDAIAVIFAPGQALPGQSRQPINGVAVPVVVNYLDLQNSTLGVLAAFAKTGPSDTFNDHVITLTRAELMPEIEAAVADRFARQIAPSVRTAYSGAPWTGATTLPFAVTFADPSAASSYQGGGATQGLLPVTHATTGVACSPAPCNPAACSTAGDPLCAPGYVNWRNTAVFTSAPGSGATPTASPQTVTCTPPVAWPYALSCQFAAKKFGIVLTDPGANFSVSVTANNVGNALRRVNSTVRIADENNNTLSYTVNSATLNADGSATVNLTSSIPPGTRLDLGALLGGLLCPLGLGFCSQYTVNIPVALFSDHAIVEPNNPSSDWFFRNNWHQLSYYAIAPGAAPGQTGCTAGTNCLTVNYLPASAYANNSVRGLMVMAGRQLPANAPARPSANINSYLEGNNSALTTTYDARAPALAVNRTFNDHIVVIDHN